MVVNQIMMINKPGNEKIVEKASDELNLSTLSSIKSETDLLSILHNLFGAIKGKMVMQIIIIHDAKEKLTDNQCKNQTLFVYFLLNEVIFYS